MLLFATLFLNVELDKEKPFLFALDVLSRALIEIDSKSLKGINIRRGSPSHSDIFSRMILLSFWKVTQFKHLTLLDILMLIVMHRVNL